MSESIPSEYIYNEIILDLNCMGENLCEYFINIFWECVEKKDFSIILNNIYELVDVKDNAASNFIDSLISAPCSVEELNKFPDCISSLISKDVPGVKLDDLEFELRKSFIISMVAQVICVKHCHIKLFENIFYYLNAAHLYLGRVEGIFLSKKKEYEKYKRGALAKLEKDPVQQAKTDVYECWQRWQRNLHEYKSKSAFARAMLDKYSELGSQQVIVRWCNTWAAELSMHRKH